MQSCRNLGKLVLQDHKADAEYFNKPLENYAEMAIIFENSLTTGNYAKDSSLALGSEDVEHGPESNVNVVPRTPDENGASS
ncbi:hypothetical protein QOZ80_4AG0321100 [Eleusine coracana subsp. coracana]|nr:hypothetical protein QOZ80_4AG0321100 [Eleusine coracana subsp. coracana]